MDLTTVQTLISTVGFPIACVFVMAFAGKTVYTDIRTVVSNIIETNTQALQKISEICTTLTEKVNVLSDKVDDIEQSIETVKSAVNQND